MVDSDKVVSLRVPQSILEIVDTMVDVRLYSNRAEVLREILRAGMKSIVYHGNGGFCQDLRQMVDCCHDDQCKYHKNCKIYTE